MVRRYRYRRRYSRLSNRRIFGSRSARSQASQIAALRNRMNKYMAQNRPEIKQYIASSDAFTLSSQASSGSYYRWKITMPPQGTDGNERVGDKIKFKNINVFGYFEYYNSVGGYHNSESAGTPVRVIVVQDLTSPVNSVAPDVDDLLAVSSFSGQKYSLRAVSPFKPGISELYKVLYDGKFNLTLANNQHSLDVNIHSLKDMEWIQDTPQNLFVYIIPCGLHWDANYTENVHGYVGAKIAFTDA